jgi:SAM-dependent methyltransferase
MEEYTEANRARWDELVPIHLRSAYYDVDGFKSGRLSLSPVEREELGGVEGLSLLHLQCHFGLDTLSWARLGARVVGVDFSEKAIGAAQALAAELGIDARFVCSDVNDLPNVLEEQFDIVFTSYGVLCWLPDIEQWANVAAHFLLPGGTFHIVEFHPFACVFDDEGEVLRLRYPYFSSSEPLIFEGGAGSYADRGAELRTNVVYSWTHSLSEVLNAIISAGLSIDFLHEFSVSPEAFRPGMERGPDGVYRLKEHGESIPLLFSIKATKRG